MQAEPINGHRSSGEEGHERWMARALALAARGAGHTSPNPSVGAVIVRSGQVVGEGYHRRAGSAHAEVDALRQAGEAARGATLYVTLAAAFELEQTAVERVGRDILVRGRVARDPSAAVEGRVAVPASGETG